MRLLKTKFEAYTPTPEQNHKYQNIKCAIDGIIELEDDFTIQEVTKINKMIRDLINERIATICFRCDMPVSEEDSDNVEYFEAEELSYKIAHDVCEDCMNLIKNQ